MANTAYSHDFRDRVIQCYLNRGTSSARDVASEFGISHSTLFDWISGLKFNESGESQQFSPKIGHHPKSSKPFPYLTPFPRVSVESFFVNKV